ncbi:MAG: iron-containing alcohol dehydrogenase [Chloroflexi bacterium]|nr:iron-containing alcohol dehydrogenase [Chloroflexota bacterium]
MPMYEFHAPPLLLIGAGSHERAAEAMAGLGAKHVLVVTDPFLHGLSHTQRILADLRSAGLGVTVFDNVGREPTTEEVDGALASLRASGADAVMSIGGGSPMDTAKATAAMATHPGTIVDYAGLNKLQRARLPLVAVPTTAGTGSEVTRAAIITDTATTVKMLVNDWKLVPDVAVVDPLFTASLPPKVTADSGVDALTHAIEAYIGTRHNPTSDVLALAAVRQIRIALPRAWANGQDARAREAMMLAAHHAGLAFSNSCVAMVHAMSRPLGAYFGTAHGLSNALLLPVVMEFTAPAVPERFRDLAGAFGLPVAGLSAEAAAERFVQAIAEFCRDLGVPSMTGAGIPRERILEVAPQMARDALTGGSAIFNPRQATEAEIVEMYHRAM